jgi:2-keto-4-pentenoate hydratase/2-oxohepta-3-ene-1,7-dioic acid hydratase in catechol pathway
MKLVTFLTSDLAAQPGVLRDNRVFPVDLPDMRTLFELGDEGMRAAREAPGPGLALDDVRLTAPIVPKKFFHTSGNFREHAVESRVVNFSHEIAPWIVFFQNTDAIVGPEDPVIYPSHLTRELDHEIEIAIVIGKAGKHFGADEAEDYIAGYTMFNDITARDIQRHEMKSGIFSFCKAIDTFCPVGPWIVTADEFADPMNLDMELRVNGEIRQKSNTSHMWVTMAQLVAHHSSMGYSPGDLLTTGTVAGVAGFKTDAERYYLQPGDVVECEVEGMGILRNPVISWEQAYGTPAPVLNEPTYTGKD